MPGAITGCHNQGGVGVLLAFSGSKPGMLLATLRRTRQLAKQIIIWPQMSTVFKLLRFDLLVSPPAQRPLEIKKVVIQQTSGGRNSLSLKTLRACPTTSNFFFFFLILGGRPNSITNITTSIKTVVTFYLVLYAHYFNLILPIT